MSTLKARATKVVNNASKNIQKQVSGSIDAVVERTESLRGEFEKRAEETAEQTRRRAARLALSVVDFQKTTFDNMYKAIAKVQEKSENAVSGMLHDSAWLPGEGKEVVKEWVKLMRSSRADFSKTVGTSFDLITDYLKRVEAEGKKARKKAATKKTAAKKTAPKKAAAKKAAAAPKKAPAKKKAAAKKKATA